MMLQKVIFQCESLKEGEVTGLAGIDIYNQLALYYNKCAVLPRKKLIPFSVSPLRGIDIPLKKNNNRIKEGCSYCFGVTALDEESVEALNYLVWAYDKEDIQFGNSLLRCQEIRLLFYRPKSYLRFMTEIETHDIIRFNLLSPLSIVTDSGLLCHPKPGIIMGRLLQKWNMFSGSPFPDAHFNNIRLSRYKLTPDVFFDEGFAGSKGYWEYAFSSEAKLDYKWMVNVLARYASLAGVGDYTEKGMGQAKVKGRSGDECA